MAYIKELKNVSFDYEGDTEEALIELPNCTETDDIECGWLSDLQCESVWLVHIHTPQEEWVSCIDYHADFDDKFIDTKEYVEVIDDFKKCDEPRTISRRRILISAQHIVACVPGLLVKRSYQYASYDYAEEQYRRNVETELYFLSPKAKPVFQGKQI